MCFIVTGIPKCDVCYFVDKTDIQEAKMHLKVLILNFTFPQPIKKRKASFNINCAHEAILGPEVLNYLFLKILLPRRLSPE